MITLADLDHLRDLPSVRFRTEKVDSVPHTIISYMISNPSLWDIPFGLECRGITFDASGEVVCRPFEKFFRFGENKYTHPSILNSISVDHIFEKRDGSMVTPVLVKNKLYWKSKKSFYSDLITDLNQRSFPKEEAASYDLLLAGYTPIWEYTTPNFRIVIDYGSSPSLTLLAARHMVSGAYLPRDRLQQIADEYKINLIPSINLPNHSTVEQMHNFVVEQKNIEGYVLYLSNKQIVKLKTRWYDQLHHTMTVVRERDIALMVSDETIDDFKAICTEQSLDLTPVLAIEQKVCNEINSIILRTTHLYQLFLQEKNRKDIAAKYLKEELFSLAIKLYEGNEPDYVDFWKKNYYKNYGLTCIYNGQFSR